MNINEIFGSPTRIERKFKDSIFNDPDAIKSWVVQNVQRALGSGFFSYMAIKQ